MKRRSKAGGQTIKARRRKSAPSKRLYATTPLPSSPNVSEDEKAARFERERNEALKQLSAASEVLGVIANSSGNLNRVFETILENATRICEATFGNLWLREDDNFRIAATHGTRTEWREYALKIDDITKLPTSGGRIVRMDRGSVVGRAAIERRPVHIPDVLTDPEYTEHEGRKIGGWRAALGVPLLREGNVIGVLFLSKAKPQAFTDKQIALVQSFAAQAVIAIENARLLNELRESLERQTATADILRVIASTPEDSKRALDTIAQTASHMFGVANVNFRRIEGDVLRIVSSAGPTTERLRKALPDIPLEATDPAVRCFLDNRQIPVEDRQAVLTNERGAIAAALRELPVRSQVFTPLSRQDKAIGVMIVTRGEVQPFQQSDLDLMKGFADQAVIAIENARLLNELRDSLQRQTATADILRVIASTPEDSKHALDTIAETASRMFDTANVNFRRLEGSVLRMVSAAGPSVTKLREVVPDVSLEPTEPAARCVLENRQIAIEDRQAALPNERGEIGRALHDLALRGLPIRSQAFTPLLRQGKAIGVMIVSRGEVRPFQEHELELMKGFADQAVIAIENSRLLGELRESYRLVQQQARKLEDQSQELVKLNQQLEQRVADQVGEIERMGRLRRFLPPQVADLIVASGTEKQLESHRREITALFRDLRGFTGFSESSDPEDVMALLRDYHAAIGEIIIKYSGTLERYAGDGVMVVFNDPVPSKTPRCRPC